MARLWWILIIVFGAVASGEAVLDRVVAVVNQEIITLSEVDKVISSVRQELRGGDPMEEREKVYQARRQVLDRLIEERLLNYEAQKFGVKVTGREVESAIEDIKHQNHATQEDLEKALAKEGMTFEAYKKHMEQMLMRAKLIRWNVKADEKVEEAGVKDHYAKNMDKYRRGASYRLGHIQFGAPRGASPEKIREARKKCQTVLDKIKRGEDFGEMALLYSEDPSAKDRGDLGYFKKGELLPRFEQEALRLKVGQVSEIIQTEFGFHILKLLDRKGGDPVPYEEVKESVRMDYLTRKKEKAVQAYIESLREKAVIEIRL